MADKLVDTATELEHTASDDDSEYKDTVEESSVKKDDSDSEEESEAPSEGSKGSNKEETAKAPGSFQQYYEDQRLCPPNYRLPLLMLVSEEVVPGFKLDSHPYNQVEKISSLKPTKKHIVSELNRRSNKDRKFKNEKNEVLKALLFEKYPLTDKNDIAFIQKKEKEHRECLLQQIEQSSKPPASDSRASKIERLRFVHLFYDTNIATAFKRSQSTLSRYELDARNSSSKAPDFFDLAVSKFNNPEWVPHTLPFPDLHDDYVSSYPLPLRSYVLSRNKAKDILSKQRAKLIKIIDNYNLSGNGAFQKKSDAQSSENFDIEETLDGTDRKNFLAHDSTDLLYWWETLEQVQVLDYLIGLTPSLEGDMLESLDKEPHAKRSKKDNDNVEKLSHSLNSVSAELAHSRTVQVTKEVINLKRRRNELRQQHHEFNKNKSNKWRCDYIQAEINDLQVELENLEAMRQINK
jgi:hypothetical protein